MYVRVCSFYTIVSLRFCLLFEEKAEKKLSFQNLFTPALFNAAPRDAINIFLMFALQKLFYDFLFRIFLCIRCFSLFLKFEFFYTFLLFFAFAQIFRCSRKKQGSF